VSYDITIWCTQPFDDPTLLPLPDEWIVHTDHWSYARPTWVLNTGPSAKVLPEDIPEGVLVALPGIAYLTEISLEPIGAPKTGFAMLRRLSSTVAKHAYGVIHDPQEDSVELPGGVKRFVPAKHEKEQRFALIKMSWWWSHSHSQPKEWVDEVLDALETYLPEAMPKRYGLWEPPQHIYAETGRAHLSQFLGEHLSDFLGFVWYANRPVVSLTLSELPECEWLKRGHDTFWVCHHASVSIEAAALAQPGWPAALRRFWERMSLLLQPFYGEVRTLHGYTGRPPRIWCDKDTETGPTMSSRWMGIPTTLGHSVVLGEPYRALWPGFEGCSDEREGLLFASTDDWSTGQDLTTLVGSVPSSIALPFVRYQARDQFGGLQMMYPDKYPAVFPFGDLPPGVEWWDGKLPPEVNTKPARAWWPRKTK
jgi:hypothetical protein